MEVGHDCDAFCHGDRCQRAAAASDDHGDMWPTQYAPTDLTDADEARIAAFVKKSAELRSEIWGQV
jgi:hypothetical protein